MHDPVAPTEGSCLPVQNAAFAPDTLPVRMYCVYILASASKALYIGVTNDLRRRLYEHKTGEVAGFATRYRINRLVYYECASEPRSAIEREKQLKGWRRERKLELIESQNPEWEDLADKVGLGAMAQRVC